MNNKDNHNLTTNNQNLKNIQNKYNNWKNHNHNNFCDCNIHKQREYYKKLEDYNIQYNKKYKPKGYLQEYDEYDLNNYT